MTFVFRPVAAVATMLALAILIALGSWQLQRRVWKEDLMEKVDARIAAAPISLDAALARASAGEDMEYAPVRAAGVFAHDLEAPVFGVHESVPGAFVFTPLEIPAPVRGSRFVYVNRGFVPQALRDPQMRAEGQTPGEVAVEGLLRYPERPAGLLKRLQPADQPEANLWYQRNPQALAERHGIDALPVYIDSFGDETGAAWPKGRVTRIEFANRHLEYAMTWYGLAAALLGVFVFSSLRRRP